MISFACTEGSDSWQMTTTSIYISQILELWDKCPRWYIGPWALFDDVDTFKNK